MLPTQCILGVRRPLGFLGGEDIGQSAGGEVFAKTAVKFFGVDSGFDRLPLPRPSLMLLSLIRNRIDDPQPCAKTGFGYAIGQPAKTGQTRENSR